MTVKEAAEKIKIYKDFVKKAQDIKNDECTARKLVIKMQNEHDAICKYLYKKEEKVLLGKHIESFASAKREKMGGYKPKKTVPTRMVATNVYDDDDRPTSHTFFF